MTVVHSIVLCFSVLLAGVGSGDITATSRDLALPGWCYIYPAGGAFCGLLSQDHTRGGSALAAAGASGNLIRCTGKHVAAVSLGAGTFRNQCCVKAASHPLVPFALKLP